MGLEPVPPDWPPLSEREVRQVFARIPGIERPAPRLCWHSPRPFSSAALVSVGPRELLVKRHSAALRTVASLEAEHSFARHLAASGMHVPRLLNDGSRSAWEEGGFVYEVQEALAGHDLYATAVSWSPFLSGHHAVSAGAALARLHLASAGYREPPRPVEALHASMNVISSSDPVGTTAALSENLPGLEAYLSARRWREELAGALAPLHEKFLPHAGALGKLWGHNDWHPSNLLWSSVGKGAEVAGVIDFGLANQTSACYDLATALERSVVGWLAPVAGRPVRRGQVRGILRGYISERPLGAGEAAALPHLFPLAHVDYALSEVDYFSRVVRSPANADLAYEGYLLGHLRWFSSSAGRRLCSYVADVVAALLEARSQGPRY